MVSLEQLTGCCDDFIAKKSEILMHSDVVAPWCDLVARAKIDGIGLSIASAYRSFDRQLTIWNEKAIGKRPVFDAKGDEINVNNISEHELLFSMLHWSALPGASRHHWGTDFDVFDSNGIDKGESFSLQTSAYSHSGYFFHLADWLDRVVDQSQTTQFIRPYRGKNKIAVEPWHLSYAPVARRFQSVQTKEMLFEFYSQRSDIYLMDGVLRRFDDIFDNYIAVSI